MKNLNHVKNANTYITNAKKKGLKNPEIEKNLRNSKWSSEQIRYVMRKYAGKRTGMIMLPFMKKRIENINKNRQVKK